jgi:photosystem II stability/assembly factor-like uncharacterized protein
MMNIQKTFSAVRRSSVPLALLVATVLLMGASAAPARADSIFPAGSWQQVGPAAAQPDLFGVALFDPDTAWVAGENGAIAHTTNGGTSWAIQQFGTGVDLRDVVFTDADHGWCVGESGTILHTTDGGDVWQAQASGVTSDLWSISAVDETHAWTVGDAGVVKATTNGGATWQTRVSGTTSGLRGVFFAGLSDGWAVGDAGTVVHSSDGGSTWAAQSSGVTADLRAVLFDDGGRGCAVGAGGAVVQSTNAGATWTRWTESATGTPTNLETPRDLNACVKTTYGTFLAVGDIGLTMNLSPFADSTPNIGQYATADLNDHAQLPVDYATSVWYVGDDGLVTRYDTSTWSMISVAPQFAGTLPDLQTVGFADAQTGWTVGSKGAVYKTTDGGSGWQAQASGVAFDLYALGIKSTATAWAAGDGTSVIKTTNGGASWSTCAGALPSGTWVTVAYTPSASHPGQEWLWAASREGTVCHSTDGGASWQQQVAAGYALTCLSASTDQRAFLINPAGVSKRTTDGGATWTVWGNEYPSLVPSEMVFRDQSHGWAIDYNQIVEIDDTGDTPTWELVMWGDMPAHARLAVAGDHDFWVTGDEGTVRHDTSQGWLVETTGVLQNLHRAAFTSTTNGCAVGDGGVILHTTNGGFSDIWAPETTCAPEGPVYANSDAVLQLTANDAESGIATTEYQVDGRQDGMWVEGTSITIPAPVDHSNDGVHTVYFHSVDTIGNVEAVHSLKVIIDTVAPSVYVESNPPGWLGYWVNEPLTILFGTFDPVPVTTSVDYRIDELGWNLNVNPAWSIQLPAPPDATFEGEHVVTYRGSDQAGNVSEEKQFGYAVDTRKPKARAPSSATATRGRTASLKFRIDDLKPNSGYCAVGIYVVKSRKLVKKIFPSRWYTANAVHSVSFKCTLAAGTYQFYVVGMDGAGNSTNKAAVNKLVVH